MRTNQAPSPYSLTPNPFIRRALAISVQLISNRQTGIKSGTGDGDPECQSGASQRFHRPEQQEVPGHYVCDFVHNTAFLLASSDRLILVEERRNAHQTNPSIKTRDLLGKLLSASDRKRRLETTDGETSLPGPSPPQVSLRALQNSTFATQERKRTSPGLRF